MPVMIGKGWGDWTEPACRVYDSGIRIQLYLEALGMGPAWHGIGVETTVRYDLQTSYRCIPVTFNPVLIYTSL